MSATDHTIDAATLAAAGSKATYGGATASVLGWLTYNEFAVLIGAAVAVGGFLVNWYYKAKDDRRRQLEHDRAMEARR